MINRCCYGCQSARLLCPSEGTTARTHLRLSAVAGMVSPLIRFASSENYSKKEAAKATSPSASASGLPASLGRIVAMSSVLASMRSHHRRKTPPRSLAVLRPPRHARSFCSDTAASTSVEPYAATAAMTAPVAGSERTACGHELPCHERLRLQERCVRQPCRERKVHIGVKMFVTDAIIFRSRA